MTVTVKELIALLQRVEDKEIEAVCGLAGGSIAKIRRMTVETGNVVADRVCLDECASRPTDDEWIAKGDRRIL